MRIRTGLKDTKTYTDSARSSVRCSVFTPHTINLVYALHLSTGKFLPTRRTPGISTSDLLARLVSGYRLRIFDKKLAKMGMHQLMAEGSDWDESRSASRVASRIASRAVSPTGERENKDSTVQVSLHFA